MAALMTIYHGEKMDDNNLTIEKLMQVKEQLEKDFPKPHIEAIVITRKVFGKYRAIYEDKEYFLIDPVNWFQIERYVREKYPTPHDDNSPFKGVFGSILGIPVFEDEELAGKILSAAAKKLYKNLTYALPLE